MTDTLQGTKQPSNVRVIGRTGSATAHKIRDYLQRSDVPFVWVELENDQQARTEAGVNDLHDVRLPVCVFPDSTRISPGRIERNGFEYYRHGTLSLHAALETATGRVHGKTTARHTSQDFVAFLEQVVAPCLAKQQIHIILDNLSDLIARGVFTSVADLARKIKRYINAYSANDKPILWKYSDPKRRIRSNELTATVH